MPGKSLPHTKQTATSADLEWGSDSLSRIYKAMTPGQEDAVMEADYLTEFGDRPYSWRMTVSQSEHYQAQFTIPETGMVYKVSMWVTKWPKPQPRRQDGSIVPSPPPLPSQWEFGFGLHKAADHAWNSPAQGIDDIVGKTGVEIPVFATVIAIFKEMVKRARPRSVVYTAKAASRARLYSRFTRMVQRVIPGYKGFEVKSGSYEVRSNRYVPEECQMQQKNAVVEADYLTEFGDRPYPWRMTVSRDERYQAQFTVPGSKIIYTVSMWATKMTEPGFLPPLPIEYEFGFSRNNAKTSGRGSFSFGGDTTIIGKTGVEIPVFATVVAIFKAMVKVAKPKRVVYTAKGASRQRLYSRLTRMIQRVIPGYKGFEVKPGAYEIRSNRYVPEEHTMSIPTFREYLYESNDATPPLVTDVPPPEMEAWMRENKASYVKQHGEETGMVRLTAAAWDIHNREKAKQDSSMEPTP